MHVIALFQHVFSQSWVGSVLEIESLICQYFFSVMAKESCTKISSGN